MAYSRPIIASNVGGLNEIIDHKINGVIFENRNYKKLSESVINLLKDDQLYKELVKNGYKKFKLNFTSEIMAKNYYNLIHCE